MQQKYIYSYNGVWNWFRGILPVLTRGSVAEAPAYGSTRTLVWRNHVTDNYKVAEGFTQLPLDLSNFLFIRTRESLLLKSKVHNSQRVLKSGKAGMLGSVATKSLAAVDEDIQAHLKDLESVLYVLEPAEGKRLTDLPVAFASNTLYVLERNSVGARDSYSKLLIPIIKQKAEYLHAEGLAQTIWALAHAGLFDDKALWTSLAKAAEGKDFNPLYVQNGRWTTASFYTHGGAEHFFQAELNEFANQLFFQGKPALHQLSQTTSTSLRPTTGSRERRPATQS